jgi:hypothetical protein
MSGAESFQRNHFLGEPTMSDDFGFYISNIKVTGFNKEPAKLSFEKGFNVISGLSDTGKSYIFACINFMLGGGDAPKYIPEANGYTDIYLEIKSYTGKTFTLNRNIKGGHFKLKEVEIEKYLTEGTARELKEIHSSTASDNISTFLLTLSGFEEKFVKKDKYNKKRGLSFRDIAGLTLVDEERIITTKAPVYVSGQYSSQTAEQSVFEILLTGKDAKELEQVEEGKIYQSRIKGKIEFLDTLIKTITAKVISLKKENTVEKQKQLQVKIDRLSIVLQKASLELEILTKDKQNIYNDISKLDSKNLLHDELKSRFLLLQEHYNSDIKRLEFIIEGEGLFSQLATIECPFCGGEMDKDHYDCLTENGKKSSSIIESIEIEIEKIKIKLLDLESTLKQLALDKSERDEKLANLRKKYNYVCTNIQTNIEPVKSATKQEIDLLIQELSLVKEQNIFEEQLSDYNRQKWMLQIELDKKPKAGEKSDGLKYSVLQSLCDTIKNILTSWKYPEVLSVTFNSDYKTYDFIIDNKARAANGKGIRAITYSAFIIGLMDYCIDNNLPHSKNIIIDSSLTTYHGREPGEIEDISIDMQDAFFFDLSDTKHDRQIVILDNKDPREELKAKINYIHFTNDKRKGRQGFFPM